MAAAAPRPPLTLRKTDLFAAADDEMDGIEVPAHPHGDGAEEGEGKMEGVEGTNTGTENGTVEGDESEMQEVEEECGNGQGGERDGEGEEGMQGFESEGGAEMEVEVEGLEGGGKVIVG